LLHLAAESFSRLGAFPTVLVVFGLTLGVEFVIPGGSSKAFLLMPIILPLADLHGATRQASILAYTFGDGFPNLLYPSNPVLLISLGLTVVSYPKWLRWTASLWLGLFLITVVSLWIAVAIGFGPF
jgi:uncharacterized ion transporter superfamily protein YfcC